MTAVLPCCGQPLADHRFVTTCEEQIHYPDEDYPCLCEGPVAGDAENVCGGCAHPVARHATTRLCGPAS